MCANMVIIWLIKPLSPAKLNLSPKRSTNDRGNSTNIIIEHPTFHIICYTRVMKTLNSNTKPLVGARLALFSILGFWLFYAIIVTLRAAVMDFPSQMEIASRRGIIIALGIGVTWMLYLFLRLFDLSLIHI